MWYFNLYKGRAWYTKAAIAFVSCIVGFIIWLGLVDINFLWLFGKSPGYSDIIKPPTFEASEIYSTDGKLIGKFFKENRSPIEFHEVNQVFWKALIDTEDERFYHHHGIDFRGVGGAAKDAATKRGARGASTITQQLAKNMFHMRGKQAQGPLSHIPGIGMLITKSKEWILATKIELIYDKREILTMYANTVDFGNNAYGIKTAAKTYFNTTPAELTTEQAAVLVGLLKATSSYNPILHPEKALERRNVVLQNMVKHGDLTESEANELSALPIKLDVQRQQSYAGQAEYFREAIAAHLKEWCSDNGYDLYSSGLKIYTTLDTRMQKYAERAAAQHMRQMQSSFKSEWGGQEPWRDERGRLIPNFILNIAKRQPFYKYLEERYHNNQDSINYYLNKPHRVKLFDYQHGTIERTMSSMDSIRYMVQFLHCGMVAMEPQTGAVRAWVGDIDFKSWKYDKVTAQRQPGSTFKLFVYTEAINQGLTPCDRRCDEPIILRVIDRKTHSEVTWAPGNASGHFSGDSLSLKTAFARSVNSVAVRLGQEVGVRNIIKAAQDMGIKSELTDEPSLALGSCDVNLLEMVNAYCTVANDGKRHDPVLVERIVDKDGNEIYIGETDEHKVLSYRTAFLMQQMLMGGVQEGTSQRLKGYITSDTDWGGKTGTTNNNSDGWFIGVSPRLVVGAWVGGEYRSIHCRSGALGQGARSALPICGAFINSVFHDNNFKEYHAHWNPADEMEVEPYMYDCDAVRVRRDTTDSVSYNDYYYEEPQASSREQESRDWEQDYDQAPNLPNDQTPKRPNDQSSNLPTDQSPKRPIPQAPKPRIEAIEE